MLFIKTMCFETILIVLLFMLTHVPSSAAESHNSSANLSKKALETSSEKMLPETTLVEVVQRLTDKKNSQCAQKCAALLTPLAEKGNTEAMLWLGRMHRDELDGNKRDLEKAFAYFEKAGGREGNNHEAQYDLARAYLYGEGTDRNLIAAFIWTTLSLDSKTPVEAQAKQQQKQLNDQLSKPQIQSAQLLVDKIRSLYLNQ